MRRLKLRVIFFLIFCLPGLVAVAVSLQRAADGMALRGSGVVATGTIIGYERTSRRRIGLRLCPIVRFVHEDASHEFTDPWCNKTPREFPNGTPVNVRFHAADPARARVDDFAALYGASLFIGAIAAPWLLLGIALIVRVR